MLAMVPFVLKTMDCSGVNMKISICSDVHLEFGPLELKNVDEAQVLILSGDIMLAQNPDLGFLQQCSSEFDFVIYVAGNHEFYHGYWNKSLQTLKQLCFDNFHNVYFLENDQIMIEDMLFLGCTLWSDMNGYDPRTMWVVKNRMNDYRQIKFDESGLYRRIDAEDTAIRHKQSREWIEGELAQHHTQKTVVVTHHAPSKLSTHPRYKDEYEINGAYSSDLSEVMLQNPQIKLWTHGHTHEPFDYEIGSCRVVCNPRGYDGYEHMADRFQLKTVIV